MKKPAMIETTVRLFPDKEFEPATTRNTDKGHVIDPPYNYHLRNRDNFFTLISKKNSNPSRSGIETRENKRGIVNKIVLLIRGQRGYWNLRDFHGGQIRYAS